MIARYAARLFMAAGIGAFLTVVALAATGCSLGPQYVAWAVELTAFAVAAALAAWADRRTRRARR